MQVMQQKHLATCHASLHVPPLFLYIAAELLHPPPLQIQVYINPYLTPSDLDQMAEHHPYQQSQLPPSQPRYQAVKAASAATAGGSLLVLSGLTLAGTIICLAIATPLLVIFSPVLVPAVITVALLMLGFVSSGGFGLAGVTVLSWIYRYVTGKHPPGADQLDQARHRLAIKAREIKDRAEQFGQQHITSS